MKVKSEDDQQFFSLNFDDVMRKPANQKKIVKAYQYNGPLVAPC